jgi:hypothetical protein
MLQASERLRRSQLLVQRRPPLSMSQGGDGRPSAAVPEEAAGHPRSHTRVIAGRHIFG